MAAPDFVVVGHVLKDLKPDGGWRAGGTVIYAGRQAARLGRLVGVVTRAGPDVNCAAAIPEAAVVCRPAEETTCFENRYEWGRRMQWVSALASRLEADDIPLDWRKPQIALLGSVSREIAPGVGEVFDQALVGVTAQGWLRRIGKGGRVYRERWGGEPFWRGATALFVSEEDLGREREQLQKWTADVPIVVLTGGPRGARIHASGRWWRINGFSEDEIDPTGAGDIFSAAFIIRLHETGDIGQATRFANAAASLSVAVEGPECQPYREQIEERLSRYPEIVLK